MDFIMTMLLFMRICFIECQNRTGISIGSAPDDAGVMRIGSSVRLKG